MKPAKPDPAPLTAEEARHLLWLVKEDADSLSHAGDKTYRAFLAGIRAKLQGMAG